MTAWTTWAEVGTAIGTLVLAGATFSSVRSSSRTARIAERTLLASQRPVLAPAGPHDPAEHVQFADGRVLPVGAGQALIERAARVIYLAIPLCNVGAGLAVLRGYHLEAEPARHVAQDPHGRARHVRGDAAPDVAAFSPQQQDLIISTARAGFWQAALRDPDAGVYRAMTEAIDTPGRVTVDVLYGDHEGSKPTVTRFVLLQENAGSWRCDATRYWSLPVSSDLRRFGFA